MMYVLPQAGPPPVVQMIAAAQVSVDLNMYELSSSAVERALADAAARGVHIRILLDGEPYGNQDIVAQESAWCSSTPSVSCRTAPARFRYDHAKYMVVDDAASEVGTANFTHDGLTRNREYLFTTHSKSLAEALETVFNADWNNQPAGAAPRARLVLSPGSEPALAALLRQPGAIDIESEEMGYVPQLDQILKRKGSQVRLILPATLSRYDRRTVNELTAAGVRVRYLSSPYMHAKLILSPTLAFVGSENFSKTSLNENREAGVICASASALATLRAQFATDWRAASGEPP